MSGAGTYGAMMTLDLGMGSCLPSIVAGTFSRNPSSWPDKTLGLLSYQLPAWVASRVPCCGMMREGVFSRVLLSLYRSLSLCVCVCAWLWSDRRCSKTSGLDGR